MYSVFKFYSLFFLISAWSGPSLASQLFVLHELKSAFPNGIAVPNDLNESGLVVGSSRAASGYIASQWRIPKIYPTKLSSPSSSTQAEAFSVNNRSQAFGSVDYSGSGLISGTRATEWSNRFQSFGYFSQFSDLYEWILSPLESFGSDINNSSVKVGSFFATYRLGSGQNRSGDGSGGDNQADSVNGLGLFPFISEGQNLKMLEVFQRNGGAASSINDKGEVTGFLWKGSKRVASFWRDGFIQSFLEPEGWLQIFPKEVNENSVVVGYVVTQNTPVSKSLAFYWNAGEGSYGVLPIFGGNQSKANDINSSNVIAGWSQNRFQQQRAFIYEAGEMRDLNQHVSVESDPSFIFENARAINNRFQILVTGSGDSGQRAFVLTPCDLNRDWQIDSLDLGALRESLRKRDLRADFNFDGMSSEVDLQAFVKACFH